MAPRLRGVKYIIGVDLSLRDSGVSVFDNTGKMLRTFSIKTTPGWTDHRSVDYIVDKFFEELEDYLTEELCDADAVVVFFEDFYYSAGGRAGAGKLGGRLQLFGVITWQLRQARVRMYAAAPSTLTSFLLGKAPTGKSKEKKKAVMDWLHVNRNFYTRNDNQADAYMCAEFGYAFIIEGQRLTVRALFVR